MPSRRIRHSCLECLDAATRHFPNVAFVIPCLTKVLHRRTNTAATVELSQSFRSQVVPCPRRCYNLQMLILSVVTVIFTSSGGSATDGPFVGFLVLMQEKEQKKLMMVASFMKCAVLRSVICPGSAWYMQARGMIRYLSAHMEDCRNSNNAELLYMCIIPDVY